MDPSLGDCGAGPQRDLRLDHPVHKTPEVQDDEDEESMMWLNDNGFVISKIMDMLDMFHLKRRTTRMPPMIKDTPRRTENPVEEKIRLGLVNQLEWRKNFSCLEY